MVKNCCVKGCNSESYAGCGISFHSFPKNESLRAKWLEVVGGANQIPCKLPLVCNRHFKKEHFKPTILPRLTDDAVPCVVPLSDQAEQYLEMKKGNTETGVVFCRTCMVKQCENLSDLTNLFNEWVADYNPAHKTTLANEISKLAHVELPDKDGYSPYICRTCLQRLSIALRFVHDVRLTAALLNDSCNITKSNDQNEWPKPIQVEKNINEGILGTPQQVEIKQEVVTDEEDTESEGFSRIECDDVDIKEEPIDVAETMPIQITVNGTITEDQHYGNSTNGCVAYENVEFLDGIKSEPISDEDIPNDLQLECILCDKEFRTVAGLRAHVLAVHDYKGVKRRGGNVASTVKLSRSSQGEEEDQSTESEHTCPSCRTTFSTSTDLRVHESGCPSPQHICFACGARRGSFGQLAEHRRRCRAAARPSNLVIKPKTLKDAMRERADIIIKPAEELTLHCMMCDRHFKNMANLKLHNSLAHSSYNTTADPDDEEFNKENNMAVDDKGNQQKIEPKKENTEVTKENKEIRDKAIFTNNTSDVIIKEEKPDVTETSVDSIFEYAIEKSSEEINSGNVREVERDSQNGVKEADETDIEQNPNSDATEIFIEIDLNTEITTKENIETPENIVQNKDSEVNKQHQNQKTGNEIKQNEGYEQPNIKTQDRKPAKLMIVDMQEINESESENPSSSADDIDNMENVQKMDIQVEEIITPVNNFVQNIDSEIPEQNKVEIECLNESLKTDSSKEPLETKLIIANPKVVSV